MNYIRLEVWQKARELKKQIEIVARKFPVEEKYRMTDQFIRAVRSVNSNIAVGHGRFTYKDQLHFCIQARRSISETLNHLIDAYDCGYILKDQLTYFKMKIDEVWRLLNGYIGFLKKRIAG